MNPGTLGAGMATYLDDILRAHRGATARDTRDLNHLIKLASAAENEPARGFAAAITAAPGLAVVAEIKRASPSLGAIAPDLDPARLAEAYRDGGAVCLSVLTDEEFFSGSRSDLVSAREAVDLPVIRKDFTVVPADVCDARLMGADAILLITAALSPTELASLMDLARQLEIEALVEVHDEAEAELALSLGGGLIGVNQRDLTTFEVDGGRAERVAAVLPEGVVKVAESGVRSAADAARLRDVGFDAILVGESLVRAHDPSAAVRRLVDAGRLESSVGRGD
ncbi:MAG: indole-3-glycerol phosphate synthase TrpC [Acidimicrobiales bacterium]